MGKPGGRDRLGGRVSRRLSGRRLARDGCPGPGPCPSVTAVGTSEGLGRRSSFVFRGVSFPILFSVPLTMFLALFLSPEATVERSGACTHRHHRALEPRVYLREDTGREDVLVWGPNSVLCALLGRDLTGVALATYLVRPGEWKPFRPVIPSLRACRGTLSAHLLSRRASWP